MVLDSEATLSSRPIEEWPFQLFISICSLLTMVSVLSFCATTHCCRRKPNKDEVDEPYGVINAREPATVDACAPTVSFRGASSSVRNSTDRFSQPVASQPGVHGQRVVQRSSVPISQPPSSTRRALPKLPAVVPNSEKTSPSTIYSTIEQNTSTKRRSPSLPYIEEPANPTYESIDAESDSMSDPLYSKLESETQSTRKYDYPVFSGRSRTNATNEEALYQSASQIYAGGSEDPYSSINSQVGVEGNSDRGYARVKDHIEKGLENQPGTSGTQLPSSTSDFDHLYTKIRRGAQARKQDEIGPSTSVPPVPPSLPQPSSESKLPETGRSGNASREPSYRYITVRESVDVIRQRINERENVARRDAQNTGSFADYNSGPVREHYYSSIGAGSDNDSASGTALYEPISDLPAPQGQSNVLVGRTTFPPSFSGYRNTNMPVAEPLTIGVQDEHDRSSPPRPPTSPIPNRLHYTSDSLGTAFPSSRANQAAEGNASRPQVAERASSSAGVPSIVTPLTSNMDNQKPLRSSINAEQKKQLRKNFFGNMLDETSARFRSDGIARSCNEPSSASSSGTSEAQTVVEVNSPAESLPKVRPVGQIVSRYSSGDNALSESRNSSRDILSSGLLKGRHTTFSEGVQSAVSDAASSHSEVFGRPVENCGILSENKEGLDSSKVFSQNNFVSQVFTEDFNESEKKKSNSGYNSVGRDTAVDSFVVNKIKETCRDSEIDKKQTGSAERGGTDSGRTDVNANREAIPPDFRRISGLDSGRDDVISGSYFKSELSSSCHSKDQNLREEDFSRDRKSFDGSLMNSDVRKQMELPASQTADPTRAFKRRITEEKECIITSEEISFENNKADEEQGRAEVERIVPIQKVSSRFSSFVPTINMNDVYKSPPGPSSPKMSHSEFEISFSQTSPYRSKMPTSTTVGVGTELDGNIMERSTDSTGSQTERTFGFDGWTGRSTGRSNIPVLRDGVEVRQRSEEARKRRRYQESKDKEVAPDLEENLPERDRTDTARGKKRVIPPPELGQLTGNDYISPVDLSTERSWPLAHSSPRSSSSYTLSSRSTGQPASPSQRMPPNAEAIFQPTSFKQET